MIPARRNTGATHRHEYTLNSLSSELSHCSHITEKVGHICIRQHGDRSVKQVHRYVLCILFIHILICNSSQSYMSFLVKMNLYLYNKELFPPTHVWPEEETASVWGKIFKKYLIILNELGWIKGIFYKAEANAVRHFTVLLFICFVLAFKW